MVEVIVLVVALAAGLLARSVSLPPMVGFLAAGFTLTPLQQYWPELAALELKPLVDIGVTILLFTVGLKLDLRSLLRPFVWAVTCIHMSLSIAVIFLLLLVLKTTGWGLVSELSVAHSLTLGFALSFSSTIFAVKVLEARGEMMSLHGKTVIGILVMQDLFAVVYLSVLGGQAPSIYAGLLLLLIPARTLLIKVLKRSGHDELLVLAGVTLAFGGYALFELADLKGDLGALFIGAILAGSNKGNELSKSLLSLKDLLLIGFFISIGQFGLPSGDAWLMALLLTLFVLIKPLLYLLLLTFFNLRAHTALFSAMTLNHYSEFGLIVTALAVQAELIPQQWLVIIALAVSFSFIISSALNLFSGSIYRFLDKPIHRLQRSQRVTEQLPIDIGNASILVMGMGRLGAGAYQYLQQTYGDTVLGFDEDRKKVEMHNKLGRNVLLGNASDIDFWQRLPQDKVRKIILALSNHSETLRVAKLLKANNYSGVIAAVAKFDDDLKELRAMDIIAFNFYAEAGAGFAQHVVNHLANDSDP